MAYQEVNSVATPEVLINHLVNFCEGAGWTVMRNVESAGQRTATITKPGLTDYIHIYNTETAFVRMRISVGYDPGLPLASQPNVSGEHKTLLGVGGYPKTFMFASQNQVWVVVAIAASGEYRHFCLGLLEKAGEYTGGTYVDGTYWTRGGYAATWAGNKWPFQDVSTATFADVGFIRVDVPDDGRSNFFYRVGADVAVERARGGVGADALSAQLSVFADDNAFSGRAILHPLTVFVARTGSQLYYSPAGTVHDVRTCSIQKFEPEQEITIGTDVWKLFPIIAKRAMNSTPGVQPGATGNYGFAIKKVA